MTRVSSALHITRLHLWVGILGIMLVVLGGRWALVDRFGTDVPEWDQWDAEGVEVLVPRSKGEPLWPHLWAPHNEHRVVLTKLANLALTAINGQWDQRLQSTVNAFLPAVLAASFLIWGRRRLNPVPAICVALTATVGWFGALAWQNVFGGFHSQQFFLLLTAFGSVTTLAFAQPASCRWWLGIICAIMGLGAMGSGFFAAAVCAVLTLARMRSDPASAKGYLITCAICVAIAAVGCVTRAPFPAHDALRAHSLADFALSLVQSLQWPFGNAWGALVMWAPWAFASVNVFRAVAGRRALSDTQWIAWGLGLWVALQLVATAAMRGAGGVEPASRYIDTLVFGAVSNACCLGAMANATAARYRRISIFASVTWTLSFTAFALSRNARIVHEDLAYVPGYRQECVANTRDYLITHNVAYLERSRVPYINAESYTIHLAHPELVALLPASVRLPLDILDPEVASGFVFTPPAARSTAPDRIPPANGLPDGFPRLGPELIWASGDRARACEWRSVALMPRSGWLRFEVAGTFRSRGVTLQLREARTNEVICDLLPSGDSTKSWTAAFARWPSKPFKVAARVEPGAGWLAFSAPRQEATGSAWARQAVAHASLVFRLGLALCAAYVACCMLQLGLSPQKP